MHSRAAHRDALGSTGGGGDAACGHEAAYGSLDGVKERIQPRAVMRERSRTVCAKGARGKAAEHRLQDTELTANLCDNRQDMTRAWSRQYHKPIPKALTACKPVFYTDSRCLLRRCSRLALRHRWALFALTSGARAINPKQQKRGAYLAVSSSLWCCHDALGITASHGAWNEPQRLKPCYGRRCPIAELRGALWAL